MLKKSTLLLSFIVLFLAGCNKSDDVEPATIIGTWEISGLSFMIDDEVISASDASLVEFELSGNQWIFDENNIVKLLPDDFDFPYTYDATTNKLTLDDEGDIYNYTADVTATELSIKSKEIAVNKGETIDIDDDDFEEREIAILALFLLDDQPDDVLSRLENAERLSFAYEFVKK